MKTTIAGSYRFIFKSWGSSGDSITVRIEFPVDDTPTTWTVVGSATGSDTGGETDALFGTSWTPTLTANDLTESGGTWTWTKNNVELTAGTIKYKVVKNHAWDTTVPSNSNATQTVSAGGTYNVTVTYNGTNVSMTLTQITKSTLTVGNVNNATVTASYNGTTIDEGTGSIANIPQGATITVKVTPETGYVCDAVTGTYSGGTVSATGSGASWSFAMPGADTQVTATIRQVTLRKVYFSNGVTGYGQVYAYVHKITNGAVTDEYLGKYPGTTMTKGENSNIWYIEVPDDETYIAFISGEGYTTGELEIPWSTYNNKPKYYPGMDRTNPSDGGAWQEYIPRTNEYDVTDGDTMGGAGLFTGITATLYDYFVDDEVTGGWLTGISSNTTNYDNTGKNYNDPYYTYLNTSLMKYANGTDMPKYNVAYPLYFGNLNYKNNSTEEAKYTSWNGKANNSNYFTDNKTAATGLSGTTLAGSTIHYYKSDGSNQNGAPMAMFDEDFLSGENATNKTLATILRTSSFPVRQEDNIKSLCLDLSSATSWEGANNVIVANFHNGTTTSGNYKVAMTSIGNHKYTVSVPNGYTQVEWLKYTSSDISGNAAAYNNAGAFASWNTFKSSNADNSAGGTTSTDSTLAKGHTYYEYDSTGGKDNAFITNIDTINKTANIDYYAGSDHAVKQPEGSHTLGFYPFDYNNVIGNGYEVDYIYFKPSTNWSASSALTYAYLWGAGQTDKWIKFVADSETGYLKSEETIPSGYTGMKFVRLNPNGEQTNPHWDNQWNATGDLSVPNNTNEVLFKVNDNNNGGSWDSDTSKITVPKANAYADSTNRYAHDHGFGMKMTIQFSLNANGLNEDGTPQVFDFSGDDDLWVFVDDKLVLDLGGAHAKTTGSINFNTKTVTANTSEAIPSGVSRNGSFSEGFNENPNYVHTMTIYYMERGMFESNLKFGFSFHALPNMFWIDKKIRTKEIINAGFYADNGQSGTASNKNAAMTASEGRFISNFEKSYQDETFTVEQKVGSSLIADGKRYTIDNDETVYYTGSNGLSTGQYPIKNDLNDCFVDQFSKNDSFTLKEIIGNNNKYVYTPKFSVWDQANNNKALPTPSNSGSYGDNTNGYSFTFAPTTNVQTAMENLNIKARFENIMAAHTLTLKKELANAADTTTDFTFQILFDFDYDGESSFDPYIAYPLYYTVDGQSQYVDGNNNKVPYQLSSTGTLTFKAGQVIEIEEIPENAKIKIVENLPNSITAYRYDSIALTKGGVPLASNDYTPVTNGVEFNMGNDDMAAVVTNRKPDFGYTLKYNYKPYVDSYTTQSYTVKGVFTEGEKASYLTLDANGQPVFQSDELKRIFVNNKAPYEDNFQQTLSFANSTIVDTGEGKGWNNDSYTCEVTAVATSDNLINVYFNLPYAVDADATLVPQPKEGTNKVEMMNTKVAKGSKEIICFDWYVTGGKSKNDKDGNDPVFVKAPLIIYTTTTTDLDTPHYFQYWQVSTQGKYGTSPTPYTRCYDYEFNFALFMDCVIEPVYGDTWAQTGNNTNPPTAYDMYERYDPELQITGDSTKGINIAFLENSRNQYNNSGNGGRTASPYAADVVYSDFLLNFNYVDGLQQLNQLSANTKKAGVVVEAVAYMDYETDDQEQPIDGVFDSDKDYSIQFKSGESEKMTAITTWLQGGSKPTGCAKSEFDVTKLDNKNCLQYYYSLNNRAYSADNGGQLVNSLQNRYKVFRAYAYIGDVKGSTLEHVQISAPVYFTIYDTASNGLPDNATKS